MKKAPEPKTQTERIALLKQRIEESGLSSTRFAENVLLRDSRTIRRWIAGESPIPAQVMDWLIECEPHPWPPKPRRGRKT
jgi:hypothetical protein